MNQRVELRGPNGESATHDDAIRWAELNDRQADALASQGFIITARKVRKVARKWRDIAVQLARQEREVGATGDASPPNRLPL